jgi:phosphopantetheine adenylyltransferase
MEILGWEIRRIPKMHRVEVKSHSSWGLAVNTEDAGEVTILGKALKSWIDYAQEKGWTPFNHDNFMRHESIYLDAYQAGFANRLGGE